MKTVLIIEDDFSYALFLGRALVDYDCHFATDFRQARERLKSQQFDLVLCDLGLPDCTREEAAAWIYALIGGATFIIVTGSMRAVEGIHYDALLRKQELKNEGDVRRGVSIAMRNVSDVNPLKRTVDGLCKLAQLFYNPKAA